MNYYVKENVEIFFRNSTFSNRTELYFSRLTSILEIYKNFEKKEINGKIELTIDSDYDRLL